jgi:hypothetical protein
MLHLDDVLTAFEMQDIMKWLTEHGSNCCPITVVVGADEGHSGLIERLFAYAEPKHPDHRKLDKRRQERGKALAGPWLESGRKWKRASEALVGQSFWDPTTGRIESESILLDRLWSEKGRDQVRRCFVFDFAALEKEPWATSWYNFDRALLYFVFAERTTTALWVPKESVPKRLHLPIDNLFDEKRRGRPFDTRAARPKAPIGF